MTGEQWLDKDGDAVPPAPAVLRRRQHEVLRRDPVPAARARLRRGPPLRRHLARVADRPTRTSSPTTPRPSGSTSCTARRGEDPTEPPALRPVPVPGRLARAAHPAAARRPRAHRPPPFHLPVGVDLDESDPEARALRALRPLRRLPVPDRRQGRRARALRAPGARAPERHAAHARARSSASRPTPPGRAVTRGRRRPRAAARSATAPTSSSSPAARSTPPRCCCARPTSGIPTASPTRPASSGRHYMAHINSAVIAISQTPNPTKFQKTLGRQRLLLGRRRLRAPARPHPDARQVRPRHPARRRAVVRARASRSTTWPGTRSTSG